MLTNLDQTTSELDQTASETGLNYKSASVTESNYPQQQDQTTSKKIKVYWRPAAPRSDIVIKEAIVK